MANYSQQSGNMREEDHRQPVSTYNAHQDEFGFKEGNDDPATDVQPPSSQANFGGGYEGQGYGDQGHKGYGDRTGETLQAAPEQSLSSTGGYGHKDMDSDVGGRKSGNGAHHPATNKHTQFGLEGKTGSQEREPSDPQLGASGATDTSSYGDTVDPRKSEFPRAPHGVESVPAGHGWGSEDSSLTHGAKKDGLVNKVKQKLPGQHRTADGTVTHSDPNAPAKKGMVEKIKEKLPGHHGTDSSGM